MLGVIDRRRVLGVQPFRKTCVGALEFAVDQHHVNIVCHASLNGCAIALCICCHHQSRGERAQYVFEFVKIFTDRGVSGRHWAVSNAYHHAGQCHHAVLQAVFTQDDDRSIYAQSFVQQRLSNTPCGGHRLCIGQMFPVTRRAVGQTFAPGHQGAIRRNPRPVQQFVGHAMRICLQRFIGLRILHAVVPRLDMYAGDAIAHVAVASRWAHGLGVTLAARPCKNASTRALASGAACVMEDISDSVMKPWSAGCSAIRGNACIKA